MKSLWVGPADSLYDASGYHQIMSVKDRLDMPALQNTIPVLDPFDIVFISLSKSIPEQIWRVVAYLSDKIPYSPIIVIGKSSDAALALQAIERGAEDFVVRDDVTPSAMERLLAHAVARKRRQAEREREYVRVASELAASYKDLETFTHTVSHDLQSPLRKIHVFTDLVRSTIGTNSVERTAELLTRIQQSSERAIERISALLEYSKKTFAAEPAERVDLNEIVGDCMTELELQIEESQARVVYQKLPLVTARREQIYHVLLNLISNAVKYRSADRAPVVEISAQQKNGEWIVSVKDNGIGIDTRERQQIFGMFRRLEHVHHLPGSGIGLAICKKIIENHGGRIWVESNMDGGSTFLFSLP